MDYTLDCEFGIYRLIPQDMGQPVNDETDEKPEETSDVVQRTDMGAT